MEYLRTMTDVDFGPQRLPGFSLWIHPSTECFCYTILPSIPDSIPSIPDSISIRFSLSPNDSKESLNV